MPRGRGSACSRLSRVLRAVTLGRTSAGLIAIALTVNACGQDTTAVTIGPPAQLVVGLPQGDVAAGLPLSVVVAINDAHGDRVHGPTFDVTLALEPNPQGATLSGTLTQTALDGIATFSDVHISRAGRSFALSATGNSISASSPRFDVRLRLTSVTVGNGMACGLALSGDAYCWGRNQTGGLGNGTSGTDRARPVLVAGNLTFTQVDAGSGSNINNILDGGGCGVVETGTAYCWGRNDYGQLGNGNAGVDSKVPVPVSGGIRFQYVSMGRDHACGLARSGEILCWGDNRGGQLGNPNAGAGSDVPVLVSGGLTYTALSVGDISSCALEVAGDAYCWGFAAPTDQEGSPASTAPALVTGGVVFAQVDPGTFLHMCGVRTSHEGYCWGQDLLGGELGTGTPHQNEATPAAVSGGHAWIYIGAGGSFSCGLRLDGVAMCWGYDYNGEVGQGTLGRGTTVPTPVVGEIRFVQMGVGHGSTCAVTENEDAYCWGSGLWGEHGDGTFAAGATPTKVVTP